MIDMQKLAFFIWCAVDEMESDLNQRQEIFNHLFDDLNFLNKSVRINLKENDSFSEENIKMFKSLKAVFNQSVDQLLNGKFLQNGRFKNEYTEIEKLGAGRFSNVYKVNNKIDGHQYAVKKILADDINHGDIIMEKIKTWSKLRHNNILRFYSSWFESDENEENEESENNYQINRKTLVFIQTDLWQVSLSDSISKINIELDQGFDKPLDPMGCFIASHLLYQILLGIEYLNEHHVIHCGLSSENIFIKYSVNSVLIKISDYGVTKTNQSKSDKICLDSNNNKMDSIECDTIENKVVGENCVLYRIGLLMAQLFCVDVKHLYNVGDEAIHIYAKAKFEMDSDKFYELLLIIENLTTNTDLNVHESICSVLKMKDYWFITSNDIKEVCREYCYKCTKIDKESYYNRPSICIPDLIIYQQKLISYQSKSQIGALLSITDMLNAPNAVNINVETNINDGRLKQQILKLVLHAIWFHYDYREICEYIEAETKKFISDKMRIKCICVGIESTEINLMNWQNCDFYHLKVNLKNGLSYSILLFNILNDDGYKYAIKRITFISSNLSHSNNMEMMDLIELLNEDNFSKKYSVNAIHKKMRFLLPNANTDWFIYESENDYLFITFNDINRYQNFIAFRHYGTCIIIGNRMKEYVYENDYKLILNVNEFFYKISDTPENHIKRVHNIFKHQEQYFFASYQFKVVTEKDEKYLFLLHDNHTNNDWEKFYSQLKCDAVYEFFDTKVVEWKLSPLTNYDIIISSDLLKQRYLRLETFEYWKMRLLDPERLAHAGFYYHSLPDGIRCAFCRLLLYKIDEGCDIIKLHREFNPECPFVLNDFKPFD